MVADNPLKLFYTLAQHSKNEYVLNVDPGSQLSDATNYVLFATEDNFVHFHFQSKLQFLQYFFNIRGSKSASGKFSNGTNILRSTQKNGS